MAWGRLQGSISETQNAVIANFGEDSLKLTGGPAVSISWDHRILQTKQNSISVHGILTMTQWRSQGDPQSQTLPL